LISSGPSFLAARRFMSSLRSLRVLGIFMLLF
jgi:hypothetical protein